MKTNPMRLRLSACFALLTLLAIGARRVPQAQAHTQRPGPSPQEVTTEARDDEHLDDEHLNEKASLRYFAQTIVWILVRVALAALIVGLAGVVMNIPFLFMEDKHYYDTAYGAPVSPGWDFTPLFQGGLLGAMAGALLGLLLAGYFLVSMEPSASSLPKPSAEQKPTA